MTSASGTGQSIVHSAEVTACHGLASGLAASSQIPAVAALPGSSPTTMAPYTLL